MKEIITIRNVFSLILLLSIITSYNLIAQSEIKYNISSQPLPSWAKKMYSKSPNVGEVVSSYNEYYRYNLFVKNSHTQYYKRWIRNIGRNTTPTSHKNINLINNTNIWTCVGPFDFDKDAASRSYAPGAAHVYTIEQANSNTDVLYAGTATAGVWKTIDKGNNWILTTKNMMVSYVNAIEIDFTNENTAYFVGSQNLYKTYDGGTNWTIIGDSSFLSVNLSANDLVMSHSNNSILLLADESGLYKTDDGGNNWTLISSGIFQEIEFHPVNSDIVYTIKQTNNKTEFYKSTDAGNTFSIIQNGWPSPNLYEEQKRTEIATTPADPNIIFALSTGVANGGSGLYGIYKSTDSGESWSFICCGAIEGGSPSISNPNLMGWSDDGTDDGGQYYYDLALEISDTNPDQIHVGGVNHWISYDGGQTFTCPAKWSHPEKEQYVHADIHDIKYFGSDLWIACDGGIFYSDDNGDNISKRMYGIAGTDFWGFGTSFTNKNIMLGGTYHNATLLKDNNTYINGWLSMCGGDNYRGFINYANEQMVYNDCGGNILSGDRNIELSSFYISKQPNASYIIGESSNTVFDPRNFNLLYIGEGNTLWKSYNNGSSYDPIHNFNENVACIQVAFSNPNIIYVSTYPGWWDDKHIYKSNDAGLSWTDITPNSSLLNGEEWIPYDITVSGTNPDILWITRTSQYGDYPNLDGHLVYKSNDGGNNWENITTTILDGQYPTNIIHHKGTDGSIYLGTRKTVYYRNNSMSDWELFDNELPAQCFSTKLAISYHDNKILNATNRSVYECDLKDTISPIAQISADKFIVDCMFNNIQFFDHSITIDSNTTRLWSFPGGNPSTSTLINPIIEYSNVGTYDVTLIISNVFGTDTQTLSNFIEYSGIFIDLSYQNLIENFDSQSFPSTNWKLLGEDFSWELLEIQNGMDCIPTYTAYLNHFGINQAGSEADLITPIIYLNPNNLNDVNLQLDYAYAQYGGTYSDGFRVSITTDCGLSWDMLFEEFGTNLQTTTPQTSSWEPECGDWTQLMFDLSNYIGEEIQIKFTAINGWGNNFFLDNIQLNNPNISSINTPNNNSLSIFPNPAEEYLYINTEQTGILTLFNVNGENILNFIIDKGLNKVEIDNIATGVYIAKLDINNCQQKIKKIIISR